MKKIIMTLTALVMAGTLFAGCGNKGKDSDSITVISREDGSGTRGAFVELLGIEEELNGKTVDATIETAIIAEKTNVVTTKIESDKLAIGYISLGSLNDKVKALKVDGVEATADNIKDGTYKVARPFNIAYKGELSEVGDDFMNFVFSAEGQEIVGEEGYISVEEGEAFSGTKPTGKIVFGGSTSVSPLIEKLCEAYGKINPNFDFEIQATGSSAGMTGVIEGTLDIGMASRELKDSEKSEVNHKAIAQDGIAVIVNKENALSDISSSAITDIYLGKTTAWADIK